MTDPDGSSGQDTAFNEPQSALKIEFQSSEKRPMRASVDRSKFAAHLSARPIVDSLVKTLKSKAPPFSAG